MRDFNGDGRADLVAVSDLSGCVSITLGIGDGTFGPTIEYRLPESASGSAPFPRSLDVADLDGDTNLDVVVSDLAHHTGWVLWGKKKEDRKQPEDLLQEPIASIFSRPDQIISTTFDTASTPIAVADVNGDGHRDIVKVNELSGSVSVLLGHGADGTFDDELEFSVGSRPGVSRSPTSIVTVVSICSWAIAVRTISRSCSALCPTAAVGLCSVSLIRR